MGMLELVVRSRLGRDGFIRTSSSLVTHIFFFSSYYFLLYLKKIQYYISFKEVIVQLVEQLYVAQ
jgi:hypothetical protein